MLCNNFAKFFRTPLFLEELSTAASVNNKDIETTCTDALIVSLLITFNRYNIKVSSTSTQAVNM